MNLVKLLPLLLLTLFLLPSSMPAAEKPAKKGTCCQQAFLDGGKECSHKCCITAHRNGQSCTKCNPGKEDLKLRKDTKTARKTAQTTR